LLPGFWRADEPEDAWDGFVEDPFGLHLAEGR
jgi:hypothetical protein